ncbi:hypothetical protein L9G16_18660, partial [Shewanella sp. A25]|nr:hypothetical protein [Shewanella shenzhenensis]
SAATQYEETMARVGITTVAALKSQADAAKETYDQVKQAKEQGIASAYEVEQAYLKWAEASLKVADAQRGGVPAILKTEAAANSLNQSLDGLIKKYSQLSNQPRVASGYQREYAQEVDNTKNAIEDLK